MNVQQVSYGGEADTTLKPSKKPTGVNEDFVAYLAAVFRMPTGYIEAGGFRGKDYGTGCPEVSKGAPEPDVRRNTGVSEPARSMPGNTGVRQAGPPLNQKRPAGQEESGKMDTAFPAEKAREELRSGMTGKQQVISRFADKGDLEAGIRVQDFSGKYPGDAKQPAAGSEKQSLQPEGKFGSNDGRQVMSEVVPGRVKSLSPETEPLLRANANIPGELRGENRTDGMSNTPDKLHARQYSPADSARERAATNMEFRLPVVETDSGAGNHVRQAVFSFKEGGGAGQNGTTTASWGNNPDGRLYGGQGEPGQATAASAANGAGPKGGLTTASGLLKLSGRSGNVFPVNSMPRILTGLLETSRLNGTGLQRELEIKLYPEKLGSLKIKAQMTETGFSLRLLVENGEAAKALQGIIPEVRQALAQQGLRLEDVQVQVGGDNGGEAQGGGHEDYHRGGGGYSNAWQQEHAPFPPDSGSMHYLDYLA